MTKRKKLNIIVLVLVSLFVLFLGARSKRKKEQEPPGHTARNRTLRRARPTPSWDTKSKD